MKRKCAAKTIKSAASKQRSEINILLRRGKTTVETAQAVKVSRQRVHVVAESIKKHGMTLHSNTLEKCESGPYAVANHIGRKCREYRLKHNWNLSDVIDHSMGVFSLSELSNFERGLNGIPAYKFRLLLKILQVSMRDVWPSDYDRPEDLATWLSVTVDELIDMVMFVTKLRR